MSARRSGPGQPLLVGRGLVKYHGGHRALAGVDITVHTGEVLAIEGPSGSGKTTLLQVLATILRPDAGEVMLQGHRVDRLGPTRRTLLRRSDLGLVSQNETPAADLTAEESAALPLLLTGVRREKAIIEARQWLVRLGLPDVPDRLAGELSESEVRRVAIARALTHRAKVIFLDEPTGALDTPTGDGMTKDVLDFASETKTAVVVATRDRELAHRMPRLVELRDGRVTGGVMIG